MTYGWGDSINQLMAICKVLDSMVEERGINQKRTLCKMCDCMAGEEGISTSELHYVQCVIVLLGKRGYQPVKYTTYSV